MSHPTSEYNLENKFILQVSLNRNDTDEDNQIHRHDLSQYGKETGYCSI